MKEGRNGTTAFSITDVGRVREKNEDSFLALDDVGLYVVADGMGGHASGEVASRISVEAMAAVYGNPDVRRDLQKDFRAERRNGLTREPLLQYELRRSVEAANLAIYRMAASDPQYRDMGTTIVAILVAERRIYGTSVGDSRIYRLRDGRLKQLSEDDSLANEYVKLKLLRPEDVRRFPYKNVIVKALGLGEEVDVWTGWWQRRKGDRFLLCSDGLSDLVTDEEIREILMTAATPEDACRDAVERALSYGGLDNITVLCVWLNQ